MAATVFDLEVWFEGQEEPVLLRADQRDMASFELEYKTGTQRAMDEMPMVFFRALGWFSARRLGKVEKDLTKDKWLDTVVSCEPVDEDEEGGDDYQGNPTSPEV